MKTSAPPRHRKRRCTCAGEESGCQCIAWGLRRCSIEFWKVQQLEPRTHNPHAQDQLFQTLPEDLGLAQGLRLDIEKQLEQMLLPTMPAEQSVAEVLVAITVVISKNSTRMRSSSSSSSICGMEEEDEVQEHPAAGISMYHTSPNGRTRTRRHRHLPLQPSRAQIKFL